MLGVGEGRCVLRIHINIFGALSFCCCPSASPIYLFICLFVCLFINEITHLSLYLTTFCLNANIEHTTNIKINDN